MIQKPYYRYRKLIKGRLQGMDDLQRFAGIHSEVALKMIKAQPNQTRKF